MDKIRHSGGFLGGILEPLLKTGLPLIGNVLKPLAKRVLIPLGLTAEASESDLIPLGLTAEASESYVAIHKKMFRSGETTLTISNEEMNDIMKIVKSL